MAQEARRESRYRMIGIAVATVALLGWLLALYFWSASAEAENELERHRALTGTVAEFETRIVTLRSEADQAVADRDQRVSELDQLEQESDVRRKEVAALDTRAQTLRDELETLETEITEGRDELAGIQEGVEQSRQQIAETSQEFSDVGERLEQARRQEADLHSSLGHGPACEDAARTRSPSATSSNRVPAAMTRIACSGDVASAC